MSICPSNCLLLLVLFQAKKDNIVLIVPGIANSSKTIYIQAFSSLFLNNGFDVVVYNHLGAHPKIKITSPRLFTYGKHLPETIIW